MLLEKIKSDDLAHLSYFLGSGAEACVIDPRRDIDAYLQLAHRNGMRITHIFETHRNEDLVSGAAALAKATGAKVWHGPNPAEPIQYADTAHDGDNFKIGDIQLRVLETPGHTHDSLSFAVFDPRQGERAFGVFTGDALFVGDVGRTDFYPDAKREMAGHLYDSLQKLMALGDQTVLYPTHGAGSVCGSGISPREVSTLGHERLYNPHLQHATRDAFIDAKVGEHHYNPPYFKLMERLNVDGSDRAPRDLLPKPLPTSALFDTNAQIVDVRGVASWAAAHVPGSLCIPHDMLGAFAGWFLDVDREICLLASGADQAEAACLSLSRIGYDRIEGFFAGIMPVATRNQLFESLPFVDTATMKSRVNASEDWTLLDVRSVEEFEANHIQGATHCYVGHLPDGAMHLPKTRKITFICGNGARATIGASLLSRNGYENIDVYLGSMKAWTHAT